MLNEICLCIPSFLCVDVKLTSILLLNEDFTKTYSPYTERWKSLHLESQQTYMRRRAEKQLSVEKHYKTIVFSLSFADVLDINSLH